jgi:hypothetical protein
MVGDISIGSLSAWAPMILAPTTGAWSHFTSCLH